MKHTFLIPIFVSVLVGCSTPEVRYDTAKHQPTTEVTIFRDGQKPSKAYKEIGMLTDDGKAVEQPNIEAKFINKAKRMGGNAIIMYPAVKSGSELSGFGLVDSFLYKASVVVYE
jgi:hypothetical protein